MSRGGLRRISATIHCAKNGDLDGHERLKVVEDLEHKLELGVDGFAHFCFEVAGRIQGTRKESVFVGELDLVHYQPEVGIDQRTISLNPGFGTKDKEPLVLLN